MGAKRDTDIAWAAGFLDGEGCILITKVFNNRNASYTLVISVCQSKTQKPLDKFVKMFGGTITHHTNKNGTREWPMHVWRARSWEARAALEEMLPYLMCKKEEAKVAIMFHKMAQKTWRMLHQDKTKHEAAYKKLQQMKKG